MKRHQGSDCLVQYLLKTISINEIYSGISKKQKKKKEIEPRAANWIDICDKLGRAIVPTIQKYSICQNVSMQVIS